MRPEIFGLVALVAIAGISVVSTEGSKELLLAIASGIVGWMSRKSD